MNRKVGKNYIYNMAYQILKIVLPIITTPYVSRVLGAEGVGIYNYTYAVVTAFVLVATLGTTSYAIREIAYVQEDKKATSQLFYEILTIRVITTVALIPVYFIFVSIDGKYSVVYYANLINLISIPFDVSWLFQGLEDFKKTVIRSSAVKVIGVVLIFLLVKNSHDIVIYTLITGGSVFLGDLILWIYLPRYIDSFKGRKISIIKHIKPVLVFFIPTVSTYIYTSLDKVVLGVFSTESEVGYYSQSEKIVKLLITVITALSTVLMPRIAYLFKNQKLKEVKANIDSSYRFVLLMSLPMMMGLFVVADFFVPLFFGLGYEKCVPLMHILLPLILLIGMASMTGITVMIPMGKQKEYNTIIILASALNLLLNMILVKKYNSYGVALATLAAEFSVTFSEMFCIKNLIDWKQLSRHFIRYFLDSVIMVLPLIMLKREMTCNWISIFEMGTIGVITYTVILALQKDPFLKILGSKFSMKKKSQI